MTKKELPANISQEIITPQTQPSESSVSRNMENPQTLSKNKHAALVQQSRVLHILLVEDDFINRTLAVAIIESHGWCVTAVENGEQALCALVETNFDCVLMDVQMPVMDGYTATRVFREQEKTRAGRLPIIAMTAHALNGDREKCLEAGMDDYVTKPVNMEELFAIVERITASFPPGEKENNGCRTTD